MPKPWRLKFNHPPTAVGGIRESRVCGVGWTLPIPQLPLGGFLAQCQIGQSRAYTWIQFKLVRPYCLRRLRWVKMPPSYAKDFSDERRRGFRRRDCGAGRRARGGGRSHRGGSRFGTERDRAFIDADQATSRAPDQRSAFHG